MDALAEVNSILDPYLFQVVGSTPESLAESLKKADIRMKPKVGARLAALAIFSAAVNRPTMETFISKPDMMEVRPVVLAALSIAGKPNMTGLTLLGHCLLTSGHTASIKFATEFKRKMGQDNLWAGELRQGSLSEKQQAILSKKQRTSEERSARLLASGFFKYVGIDTSAWTTAEARFWNIQTTISSASTMPGVASYPRESPQTAGSADSLFEEGSEAYTFKLSDGSQVNIPADVYTYYTTAVSKDLKRLVASIEKRGVQDFVTSTRAAAAKDPEMRGPRGTIA